MRGCVPSPRHRLACAAWAGAALRSVVPPDNYATVCTDYDISGNDQFGDCVSAEEANAKRAYAIAMGAPETEIPGSTVVAWARKHGYLNGANLDDVLTTMQTTGMADAAGVVHCDGPHLTVDWTNPDEMKAAIYTYKTVKIAVAANQLEHASTGSNGWMLLKARNDSSIDHCVGLHGYGSLSYLAKVLGVSVPVGQDGDQLCWLLYTWGTVGIVSDKALQAIMHGGEAWVRKVGDVVNGQPNPPAPVNPTPDPSPIPPCPGPDPTLGATPKKAPWLNPGPDPTLGATPKKAPWLKITALYEWLD